nr:Ferredoxin [Kibdelosporangium sp. MJ126-NF4]CTQ98943.1 Ferredoxin [Kibdelosporangium sp. MJ126-NF4]
MILNRDGLDRLVEALRELDYHVVGPTVRDDAIVLAELDSASDLRSGRRTQTSSLSPVARSRRPMANSIQRAACQNSASQVFQLEAPESAPLSLGVTGGLGCSARSSPSCRSARW